MSLIEIVVGVIVGNAFHISSTEWIDFLAGFGGPLTFLAGAGLEPEILRKRLPETMAIGVVGFAVAFVGALLFAYFAAGWDLLRRRGGRCGEALRVAPPIRLCGMPVAAGSWCARKRRSAGNDEKEEA